MSPLSACEQTGDADTGGDALPAEPTTPPTSRPTIPDQEQEPMRIRVELGGPSVTATLDDSPATRDLIARLPASLTMRDHGGVEKTGRLPSPLSLDGQPDGADPEPGDLGYYAPGQDLVLYYGDQSYYEGIVVLGRLDGDAADVIAAIDGDLDVTVDVGS